MTTKSIGPSAALQDISSNQITKQGRKQTDVQDIRISFTTVLGNTSATKAGQGSKEAFVKQSQNSQQAKDTANNDGKVDSSVSDDGNSDRTPTAADVTSSKTEKRSDDSKDIGDDVKEAVNEAADKVKEKIEDELGISEEDLKSVMETLGLTSADLLNPSAVTEIVSNVTGSDISAVITDETLYDQLSSIIGTQRDAISDLVQELDITPDEFRNMIKDIDTDTAMTDGKADAAAGMNNFGSGMEADTVQTDIPDIKADTTGNSIQKPEQSLTDSGKEITVTEKNISLPDFKDAENRNDKAETDTDTAAGMLKTVIEKTDNLKSDTVRTPAEAAELNGTTRPGQDVTARKSNEGLSGKADLNEITAPTETVNKTGVKDGGSEGMFNSQTSNPNAAFFENLTQAVDKSVGSMADETAISYADTQNILNQVTDQIKVSLKSDSTSMEMQLNPESLGKIGIQVTEKNGAVTAQFEAQNAAVKEALAGQVAELKQTLENQGIKVDSVEVTIASHQYEENMMQNGSRNDENAYTGKNSKTRRIINLGDETDDVSGIDGNPDESEQLARKIMTDNGNTLDYMA